MNRPTTETDVLVLTPGQYAPRAQTISADRMEALAFLWGAPIEFDRDLAYLTRNGQRYVAVLGGAA